MIPNTMRTIPTTQSACVPVRLSIIGRSPQQPISSLLHLLSTQSQAAASAKKVSIPATSSSVCRNSPARTVKGGDGVIVVSRSPSKLPTQTADGPGPVAHWSDIQVGAAEFEFHCFPMQGQCQTPQSRNDTTIISFSENGT